MPKDPDARRKLATRVAIAVIATSNVVTNRRLPLSAHVPWGLGLTAGLVQLARWAGCTPEDVGLASGDLPRSARIGAVGAGCITGGYAVMASTGAGANLFVDRRVTSLGPQDALWHLFVRIPISTVLAEEVAFRGVLPALLERPHRPRWFPGVLSSLLFGIWHVLPSIEGARINEVTGRRATARALALEVGTTTLAGGFLLFMRRRTGHLAAPMALHLAANAVGFVAARRRTT